MQTCSLGHDFDGQYAYVIKNGLFTQHQILQCIQQHNPRLPAHISC